MNRWVSWTGRAACVVLIILAISAVTEQRSIARPENFKVLRPGEQVNITISQLLESNNCRFGVSTVFPVEIVITYWQHSLTPSSPIVLERQYSTEQSRDKRSIPRTSDFIEVTQPGNTNWKIYSKSENGSSQVFHNSSAINVVLNSHKCFDRHSANHVYENRDWNGMLVISAFNISCNLPESPKFGRISGSYFRNNTIEFYCAPSFILYGNGRLECIQNQIGDYQWNGTRPKCIKDSCPKEETRVAESNKENYIATPGFPEMILSTHNKTCSWTISSEKRNYCIYLELQSMDLPRNNRTTFEIFEKKPNENGEIVKLYTSGDAMSIVPPFVICDGEVLIYFNNDGADNDEQYTGVNLVYTSRPDTDKYRIGQYRNVQQDVSQEVTLPSSSTLSSNSGSDDDSSSPSGGVIAAAVLVPLIVLIAIALAVFYVWYRRKYPVRMIVGKDFGKFSNPAYEKRHSTATLTRGGDSFEKEIEKMASAKGVSHDNPVDLSDEVDFQEYQPSTSTVLMRNLGNSYRDSLDDITDDGCNRDSLTYNASTKKKIIHATLNINEFDDSDDESKTKSPDDQPTQKEPGETIKRQETIEESNEESEDEDDSDDGFQALKTEPKIKRKRVSAYLNEVLDRSMSQEPTPEPASNEEDETKEYDNASTSDKRHDDENASQSSEVHDENESNDDGKEKFVYENVTIIGDSKMDKPTTSPVVGIGDTMEVITESAYENVEINPKRVLHVPDLSKTLDSDDGESSSNSDNSSDEGQTEYVINKEDSDVDSEPGKAASEVDVLTADDDVFSGAFETEVAAAEVDNEDKATTVSKTHEALPSENTHDQLFADLTTIKDSDQTTMESTENMGVSTDLFLMNDTSVGQDTTPEMTSSNEAEGHSVDVLQLSDNQGGNLLQASGIPNLDYLNNEKDAQISVDLLKETEESNSNTKSISDDLVEAHEDVRKMDASTRRIKTLSSYPSISLEGGSMESLASVEYAEFERGSGDLQSEPSVERETTGDQLTSKTDDDVDAGCPNTILTPNDSTLIDTSDNNLLFEQMSTTPVENTPSDIFTANLISTTPVENTPSDIFTANLISTTPEENTPSDIFTANLISTTSVVNTVEGGESEEIFDNPIERTPDDNALIDPFDNQLLGAPFSPMQQPDLLPDLLNVPTLETDESGIGQFSSTSEEDLIDDDVMSFGFQDQQPSIKTGRRQSVTLDNPNFDFSQVSQSLPEADDSSISGKPMLKRRESITLDNPVFDMTKTPLAKSADDTLRVIKVEPLGGMDSSSGSSSEGSRSDSDDEDTNEYQINKSGGTDSDEKGADGGFQEAGITGDTPLFTLDQAKIDEINGKKFVSAVDLMNLKSRVKTKKDNDDDSDVSVDSDLMREADNISDSDSDSDSNKKMPNVIKKGSSFKVLLSPELHPGDDDAMEC